MPAPEWALKERELLDINAKVIELNAKTFTLPNGYVRGKYDTQGKNAQHPHGVFTLMYKWPLIYALGGDSSIKDQWWRVWRAGLDQMTEQGFCTNEFLTCHDANHMGQGYEGFFMSALAMSDDPEYRRLALKFASFYDGQGTLVQNYDPKTKTMKSILSGGRGAVEKKEQFDPKVTNFWLPDTDYAYEGPASLIYTCLTTNAFLLTGDEHYRTMTVDYVNAWRDRCKANGGIMPTNVNRDGSIPEDWWAGILGWDRPTARFGGLLVVLSGPNAGWSNGLLLTGDTSYYDNWRMLGDTLWKHRYIDDNGTVLGVPGGINAAGFNDYTWGDFKHGGLYSTILANTYLASMKQADLDRINERSMLTGATTYSDDFEAGHEAEWFAYLQGKNPTWPVEYITKQLEQAKSSFELVKQAAAKGVDPELPSSPSGGACGSLVNAMTGGVMPRWQGQLLITRFFYLDPERKRPGISEDCAALVEKLADDSATLVLVNTSSGKEHTVIVQGGAYGEHQILSVKPDGGKSVPVNGRTFTVKIAPGAGQRLVVSMKRYANTPKITHPWAL